MSQSNSVFIFYFLSIHITLRYIVQWKAIKAILIGFSLTAINLFSGTFAFINYTANIFQAAGFDKPNEYKDSLFDPNNSSIVVACMQILVYLYLLKNPLLIDLQNESTKNVDSHFAFIQFSCIHCRYANHGSLLFHAVGRSYWAQNVAHIFNIWCICRSDVARHLFISA